MALRLLYQEPGDEKERLRNKEETIMDWTLWSLGILIVIWAVFSLHLIWSEKH